MSAHVGSMGINVKEAEMDGSFGYDSVDTSLGDLVVAIYEAALDELHDERLAQRVTAALVTDVIQHQQRRPRRAH